MAEVELKLGLTEVAAAAVGATLTARGAETHALESHYFDTAGRALARAGIALRLRRSAGAWEQTVKAEGASPVERLEETVTFVPPAGGTSPLPDLALHAGGPAAALLARALADDAEAAVAPVFATVVRRAALRIETQGAELEVALDRGVVRAGERSLPISEVEIELKDGDVGALIAVGRASVDAHAMWLSTVSKAERGAWLAEADAARATKARPPLLAVHANGGELFRAMLASCLEQVLANASVVADGEADAEAIHQLRVGLRRLRTLRRELGRWRGGLGEGWQAPAAELFRVLGVQRDRETVGAQMQRRLAACGSPAPELLVAAADHVDAVAVVRAPAFQHALLDLLTAVVDRPLAQSPRDDDEPRRFIARRLDKLHRRVRRDALRFHKLDEQSRHAVRKRLKRLRYLAELVAPLYNKRSVK
ncbi:MAG: CYTH and CHAD domain-containing protein, partial [Rhizobacter sp.]|nr:CYTH and CHAD domain-containing protein [Rhizobacter sp.]